MAVSTQISDKCLSIRLIVVDPDVNEGLSYLDAMAIAILVIGSVLVVIGFLGCCGAMKQVKIFLGLVSFDLLVHRTSSILTVCDHCHHYHSCRNRYYDLFRCISIEI